MEIAKSNIVRSDAGRDKGKLFVVLAVEGEYLLLFVADDGTRLAEKIKGQEKITNSELRRTLAGYRGEVHPDQEG